MGGGGRFNPSPPSKLGVFNTPSKLRLNRCKKKVRRFGAKTIGRGPDPQDWRAHLQLKNTMAIATPIVSLTHALFLPNRDKKFVEETLFVRVKMFKKSISS